MITNVKHEGDSGYTATIDGVKWQNITPGTYHYDLVQAWIAEGNTPDPEFTQAELDQQAADALQEAEDVTDEAAIKGVAAIQTLVTSRPTQIDVWIESNVTDLASAKVTLGYLAKAVSVLLKQRFR